MSQLGRALQSKIVLGVIQVNRFRTTMLLCSPVTHCSVLFGSSCSSNGVCVPGYRRNRNAGRNTCIGSGCHVSTGFHQARGRHAFCGMTYTPGVTQHLSVMVNDTLAANEGLNSQHVWRALSKRNLLNTRREHHLGTNGVQVVKVADWNHRIYL